MLRGVFFLTTRESVSVSVKCDCGVIYGMSRCELQFYYMCLYRFSSVIILSTRMVFHLIGFGCVFSKAPLSTYPACKMCVCVGGVDTKQRSRSVVSFVFALHPLQDTHDTSYTLTSFIHRTYTLASSS